jgi:hypothetical protein
MQYFYRLFGEKTAVLSLLRTFSNFFGFFRAFRAFCNFTPQLTERTINLLFCAEFWLNEPSTAFFARSFARLQGGEPPPTGIVQVYGEDWRTALPTPQAGKRTAKKWIESIYIA